MSCAKFSTQLTVEGRNKNGNKFNWDKYLHDEVWLYIFEFLSVRALCTCACLNRRLRELSNDEALWKKHCSRRWKSKQNFVCGELFYRGDYTKLRGTHSLTLDEIKTILAKRNIIPSDTKDEDYLSELMRTTTPRDVSAPMCPGKWKTCYACAEIDKLRNIITREEMSQFRWQLIYNGRPSNTGLRYFQPNGQYHSPYLGVVSWGLIENRLQLGNVFDTLGITRNKQDWGWTIGRGTATEYRSVEF